MSNSQNSETQPVSLPEKLPPPLPPENPHDSIIEKAQNIYHANLERVMEGDMDAGERYGHAREIILSQLLEAMKESLQPTLVSLSTNPTADVITILNKALTTTVRFHKLIGSSYGREDSENAWKSTCSSIGSDAAIELYRLIEEGLERLCSQSSGGTLSNFEALSMEEVNAAVERMEQIKANNNGS